MSSGAVDVIFFLWTLPFLILGVNVLMNWDIGKLSDDEMIELRKNKERSLIDSLGIEAGCRVHLRGALNFCMMTVDEILDGMVRVITPEGRLITVPLSLVLGVEQASTHSPFYKPINLPR